MLASLLGVTIFGFRFSGTQAFIVLVVVVVLSGLGLLLRSRLSQEEPKVQTGGAPRPCSPCSHGGPARRADGQTRLSPA